MKLTLVGLGSGYGCTLTAQARAALLGADLIIGAARLLENLPAECTQNRVCEYKTDEILKILRQAECAKPVLVYSGDTGFYSGAAALAPKLRENGIEFCVLAGISSVQLLAAALCRPWQNWRLASAHGVACDAVAECMHGVPTFFLTGGEATPASLCAQLAAVGLGGTRATVGERLGCPEQRIITGTAAELAAQSFAPLSVLLVEAVPLPPRRCAGIGDSEFCRGEVPMTKQEVRAAALAKLGVRGGDILWDIGAGTGSVSVELALAAPQGHVYAVERKKEACELVRQNRAKFGAYNLTLIEGEAPQALEGLPAPDAVFIGGTNGSMTAIIDAVLAKNLAARICVTAIALETLHAAVDALTAHGLGIQATQIAVSRTREAGGLHMLMANNAVFLVTGNCQ